MGQGDRCTTNQRNEARDEGRATLVSTKYIQRKEGAGAGRGTRAKAMFRLQGAASMTQGQKSTPSTAGFYTVSPGPIQICNFFPPQRYMHFMHG